MLAEITKACCETKQQIPETPGDYARVIYGSLAAYYASQLHKLANALNMQVNHLHIIGGGCQCQYVCRQIGNAGGAIISSGPAEASALGNIILQMHVQLNMSLENILWAIDWGAHGLNHTY